jgi:hypothetical protein
MCPSSEKSERHVSVSEKSERHVSVSEKSEQHASVMSVVWSEQVFVIGGL